MTALHRICLVLLLALFLPLAGCGFKDNLYLPGQEPHHKDSRVQ